MHSRGGSEMQNVSAAQICSLSGAGVQAVELLVCVSYYAPKRQTNQFNFELIGSGFALI